MGTHTWTAQCPQCGFEKMIVSSYNNFHFELNCQICGYAKWTDENTPKPSDVATARQLLNKMDTQAKQKAIEEYCEDGIPLIARSKENSGDD